MNKEELLKELNKEFGYSYYLGQSGRFGNSAVEISMLKAICLFIEKMQGEIE